MGIALTFLILLVLGVPIAFVLGLASVTHILINGDFTFFLNIPQRMFAAADKFSLMAIPLFVLMGELMNTGGITRRLTDFARTILGHMRGGLAYVNILVCMFLSAIIGSANAVAAMQSTSMVPEMKKDGYSNEYASALTSAASIMGPIIPPSMVFIIYGISAGTSIGALFLAGIIPGVLLGLGFFILAYIYARKHNFPVKTRESFKAVAVNFIKTSPALTIPIFVLGGIISGMFTATEAGAIGTLLAFIVGKFIYKDLEWKKLSFIFTKAGILTASIMLIIATSNIFGWILAIEQIPQIIAEYILGISTNPIVILLIINIFLLIVGCFLEPIAALVILVPVLLPMALQLGVDPCILV